MDSDFELDQPYLLRYRYPICSATVGKLLR